MCVLDACICIQRKNLLSTRTENLGTRYESFLGCVEDTNWQGTFANAFNLFGGGNTSLTSSASALSIDQARLAAYNSYPGVKYFAVARQGPNAGFAITFRDFKPAGLAPSRTLQNCMVGCSDLPQMSCGSTKDFNGNSGPDRVWAVYEISE